MPIVLAASVAAGLSGPAGADARPSHAAGPLGDPTSYVVPGDRTHPEGITREPGTERFYVTATTDGTIFKGTLRSPRITVFARPGIDGRTTAAGLRADGRGNLVVAGAQTGTVFVLSTRDGSTKKVLPTGEGGFLNDVAISRGYAYITDSRRPVLYRVRVGRDRIGEIEEFRRFENTAYAYDLDPGVFNANGIVIDRSGRFAIIADSGTGKLFRIDLRTKKVSEVRLTGGGPLTNGDGMLLRGRTLYVTRYLEELIHAVRLSPDGRRGRIGAPVTGPQLRTPTTIAFGRDRLLAVNSQIAERSAMLPPTLPFDIATIALPKAP